MPTRVLEVFLGVQGAFDLGLVVLCVAVLGLWVFLFKIAAHRLEASLNTKP